MKTYVQIGLILVAIIGALTFAMRSMSDGTGGRDQGTGLISVRVVSAPDVFEDYKTFGTSPEEGLKNQWFVVYGTVLEIEELGAGMTVTLDSRDARFGIACQLKDPADAKKVKKGDEVGIAGRGAAGTMGAIPVLNCWVLSSDQWQGKQKVQIDVGD